MIIPPELLRRWRQAYVDMIGAGGSAGFLALYAVPLDNSGTAPAAGLIVRIPLARPAGVVDDAGIALAATDYAQVQLSGDAVGARIEDSAGGWCGNFTVGLSAENPELVLPVKTFRIGAFVSLSGSRIDIANPAL